MPISRLALAAFIHAQPGQMLLFFCGYIRVISATVEETSSSSEALLPGLDDSVLQPVNYDLPPVQAPSASGQRQCYDRSDIAYVDGSFLASASYWRQKCKIIERDPEIESIMVNVGGVYAFYRPYGDNSWCDMLTSSSLHEVSKDNKNWVVPDYYPKDNRFFGGSAQFPLASRWDGWHFLPFWGSDAQTGACCEGETDNPNQNLSWGKGMLMSACRRCESLAWNPGDTHGNFWNDGICNPDLVPPHATFIRITMGAVVDYFKPADGVGGICSMLNSSTKHLWSNDGLNWKTPDYYQGIPDAYGGSAKGWPKRNNPGDRREYLSFWGSHYHRGGCCSSSLDHNDTITCDMADNDNDLRGCFHQALLVEYCV
jgi:hypothetical protein